jgi:hypothetical protein
MTTLRTALTQTTKFDVESGEAVIQRLRAEACQRLDAAPNGHEDLVAVCRLIFDILNLPDRLNQDRNRISLSKA